MRIRLTVLAAVILSVFVVPVPVSQAEEGRSFQFTASDSRSFYDGYDQARVLYKQEKYPAAIKKFEEILNFADTASKEAMVYNDLAKIYHVLEDVPQEIIYVEKASRVTTDKKQKEALISRLKGLKRQAGIRNGLKTPAGTPSALPPSP